jgi:hypothetical protein
MVLHDVDKKRCAGKSVRVEEAVIQNAKTQAAP